MANEMDPIAGNWYQHLDKGQHFFVVDVNEDDGYVEIQYFDSTIEELSLDEWAELEIEASDEPENWSGSMDVADADDLGTDITDTSGEDWNSPMREIRDDNLTLDDDWGEGRPFEEPDEEER